MKIKEHAKQYSTIYIFLIFHDKFYKFQIKISFELKIFYINNTPFQKIMSAIKIT